MSELAMMYQIRARNQKTERSKAGDVVTGQTCGNPAERPEAGSPPL